jgi:alpha-L-fucosidase
MSFCVRFTARIARVSARAGFCALAAALLIPARGADAERDARMAWWREARFGIFVHWGLYAIPAGRFQGRETQWAGEWIMNHLKIPVADYAKLAHDFNPKDFNASEWANVFRDSGAGYVIFTAKHHDGFAMFDSKTDAWNVRAATPFGRDVVRDVMDACKHDGLRFGVYYSQSQDWSHPGGRASGGSWDPAQAGDFDAYLRDVSLPQVRELVENYGPSILWWDTDLEMTPARGALFKPVLAKHPEIVTNNRLAGDSAGDVLTPEQFVPSTGFPGRDWETCLTMNDTWGYKSADQHYKSAASLVQTLAETASKGGNLLLNVGPDASGQIPQPQRERLAGIGRWMRVNGEAIRGTQASPFRKPFAWGFCTQRPDALYLLVVNWPADGRIFIPIRNPSGTARLLANPKAVVQCVAGRDGVEVRLPGSAPDSAVSVVLLGTKGATQSIQAPRPTNGSDGVIHLAAEDGDVIGMRARLVGEKLKSVGWWREPGDYVEWTANAKIKGHYEVSLIYSAKRGSAGGTLRITCGAQTLDSKVEPTTSWDDYRTASVGTISLDQAGEFQLRVTPLQLQNKTPLMNLQAVELRPAKQ